MNGHHSSSKVNAIAAVKGRMYEKVFTLFRQKLISDFETIAHVCLIQYGIEMSNGFCHSVLMTRS